MARKSVSSPWDEKFIREQPFMAFGSMMNAYGRANEGTGMSLDAFIIAADKMFEAAQRYADQAFNSVHKEDNVDIPVKRIEK